MNRWELEQKIVLKALKDPEYKKRLLAQPKEALLEVLKNEKGSNLSVFEKTKLRIVEEKQNEWVLALPFIAEKLTSLSDAELEKLFAACLLSEGQSNFWC